MTTKFKNDVVTAKQLFRLIQSILSKKAEPFEKQKGICVKCEDESQLEEMEVNHIKPCYLSSKTSAENCQMFCKTCNRKKSGK